MLNVNKEFLENFKSLSAEEKDKKVNEMSIEEIDVLTEAGYVVEVNNGRAEVKDCPEK